jgi:hypothetical protein
MNHRQRPFAVGAERQIRLRVEPCRVHPAAYWQVSHNFAVV